MIYYMYIICIYHRMTTLHNSNTYFKNIINNYISKNNNLLNNKFNIIDCDYYNIPNTISTHINQLNLTQLLGNKITHQKIAPDFSLPTYIFNHGNNFVINPQNNNKISLSNLFNIGKTFIVKPENGSGRHGIFLSNNIDDFTNKMPKKDTSDVTNQWIIQEYMTKTHLFKTLKYHIRSYSLIIYNSVNNTWQIFRYQKGFMYTAGNPYNNDINDLDSQLSGCETPDRVRQYPEDFSNMFGKSAYIKVNKQMDKQTQIILNKLIKESDHTQNIEKIAKHMVKGPSKIQYKMMGWDFLVDKNLNVHLAEINTRLIQFKFESEEFKRSFYNELLDIVFNITTSMVNQWKKLSIDNYEKFSILNNDIEDISYIASDITIILGAIGLFYLYKFLKKY
jgi:hypothetical protein